MKDFDIPFIGYHDAFLRPLRQLLAPEELLKPSHLPVSRLIPRAVRLLVQLPNAPRFSLQLVVELLGLGPNACSSSASNTLIARRGEVDPPRTAALKSDIETPFPASLAPLAQDEHRPSALALRGEGPTIFSSDGKVSLRMETVSNLVTALSAAMVEAREAREPFQLRDVRRTCETLLAGMGVSKDLRAQLQSHGLGGVQDRHYDQYQYMDEKRAVLERWQARLVQIETEEPSKSNIVPIRDTTRGRRRRGR